jgi:hypothetical protein
MSDGKTILIHPISFGVPEMYISLTVPTKSKSFSTIIPGNLTSYIYGVSDEDSYYKDMSRSLFALTVKKGGWDCMRHVEILAAGALPVYPGIQFSPNGALAHHPRNLYHALLSFPGLNVSQTLGKYSASFSFDQIDWELYQTVVAALLQYTRNVLSTKSMAAYVLSTICFHNGWSLSSTEPFHVLYLTHPAKGDTGDYMVDGLLHGLLSLLGETFVVDFPRQSHIFKNSADLNRTVFLSRRSRLYGKGYSWGLILDTFCSSRLPTSTIARRLQRKQYTVVIIGSGHRVWYGYPPFWNMLCKIYPPSAVALIDGDDRPFSSEMYNLYRRCVGHFFSREGPVDR